MQGREHLVGITAHGKELLLEILRYPNELRDPAPYFEKVTAAPKQGAVAMAAELIERQSGKLEPSKMPNEYAKTVKELVRAKVEHRMSEINLADDSCKAPKVINIMAALKESMQAKGREMVRDAVRKRMRQAAPEPVAVVLAFVRKPSRAEPRTRNRCRPADIASRPYCTPERSWTPSDGFPSPLPQSPWRRASTYARASDHWPAPILVSGRRSALD